MRSNSRSSHLYVPPFNTLTEVVRSVGFTPYYTLRAVTSGDHKTLSLRYHVRISNKSGEDWTNIALAISTARTSHTKTLPRFKKWTIDFVREKPNVFLFDLECCTMESEPEDQNALAKGIASILSVAEMQSIKNGDTDHTIVIHELLLEAQISHIARPKLEEAVYLQVRLSRTN